MNPLTFFDAHTRRYVALDRAAVTKCTLMTQQGQTRYALRGVLADGRVATKFVNRVDYDALDVPFAHNTVVNAAISPLEHDGKSVKE